MYCTQIDYKLRGDLTLQNLDGSEQRSELNSLHPSERTNKNSTKHFLFWSFVTQINDVS